MQEDEDREKIEAAANQSSSNREDNFAMDYPLHGRAPRVGSRDGFYDNESDGVDTPQLGYVPRENTQSFGMVG